MLVSRLFLVYFVSMSMLLCMSAVEDQNQALLGCGGKSKIFITGRMSEIISESRDIPYLSDVVVSLEKHVRKQTRISGSTITYDSRLTIIKCLGVQANATKSFRVVFHEDNAHDIQLQPKSIPIRGSSRNADFTESERTNYHCCCCCHPLPTSTPTPTSTSTPTPAPAPTPTTTSTTTSTTTRAPTTTPYPPYKPFYVSERKRDYFCSLLSSLSGAKLCP